MCRWYLKTIAQHFNFSDPFNKKGLYKYIALTALLYIGIGLGLSVFFVSRTVKNTGETAPLQTTTNEAAGVQSNTLPAQELIFILPESSTTKKTSTPSPIPLRKTVVAETINTEEKPTITPEKEVPPITQSSTQVATGPVTSEQGITFASSGEVRKMLNYTTWVKERPTISSADINSTDEPFRGSLDIDCTFMIAPNGKPYAIATSIDIVYPQAAEKIRKAIDTMIFEEDVLPSRGIMRFNLTIF